MTLSPGIHGILNANGTLREIVVITATVLCKDGRSKSVVMTAQPGFNPATQKVIQSGWTVNASDVTPIWQVVALTQAELDENTAKSQLVTILAAAEDMINGVGTTAQRQVRVETGCGRLLKRLAAKGVIP